MLPRELKQYLSNAIDVVLPPQSLLTGDLPGKQDGELWSRVSFLDEPCCNICGLPFDFEVTPGTFCGDCTAKPPAFDHARAAFVYDDASRRMVLGFKHGGRTEGLTMFAAHMKRAGRTFWPGADFLIPVPLHNSRLLKRRFNQSALLARRLAKIVPASFEPDILFRRRATPSQGAQTYKGRFRNVQGAFFVAETALPRLKDKHVVIIDDVMTTGATLQSCARTLKRAGAAYIDVVTLARTVRNRAGSYGEPYGQS